MRAMTRFCLTNPRLDVDLTVETTLPTMVDVWMGGRDMREALRAGAITLAGRAALTREFPRWLLLSLFAKIPAAA